MGSTYLRPDRFGESPGSSSRLSSYLTTSVTDDRAPGRRVTSVMADRPRAIAVTLATPGSTRENRMSFQVGRSVGDVGSAVTFRSRAPRPASGSRGELGRVASMGRRGAYSIAARRRATGRHSRPRRRRPPLREAPRDLPPRPRRPHDPPTGSRPLRPTAASLPARPHRAARAPPTSASAAFLRRARASLTRRSLRGRGRIPGDLAAGQEVDEEHLARPPPSGRGGCPAGRPPSPAGARRTWASRSTRSRG